MALDVTVIDKGTCGFPAALRGGGRAGPERLWAIGNPQILDRPLLGFFCSSKCPGAAIIKTYDVARSLRDHGVAVIGGFHTSMEKECLRLLLRGEQPVVICPARGIQRMRVPGDWRPGIAAGRVLVLSQFPAHQRRPTKALAEQRNQLVAALATRIVVVHAAPGSRTDALCRQQLSEGKQVYVINASDAPDLIEAGATPLSPEQLPSVLPGRSAEG